MAVPRKMMSLFIKRNCSVGNYSVGSGTSYKKSQELQKLLGNICGFIDEEMFFSLTKSSYGASGELGNWSQDSGCDHPDIINPHLPLERRKLEAAGGGGHLPKVIQWLGTVVMGFEWIPGASTLSLCKWCPGSLPWPAS